jgi:pimeloyl-ACP methyl ester carboxylesterase
MTIIERDWGGLYFDVIDMVPPWQRPAATVLFHHGVSVTADVWAEWLPALAERYRLVRFDLRGHGRSVSGALGAWSLAGLIADLLAVADAAGADRFHLIGESLGGTVALAAAAGHGDRVSSLTVSNGAPVGGTIENVQGWRDTIEGDGMAAWSRQMMGQRFHDTALTGPQRAWYEETQAATDGAAILAALEVLLGVDLRPDLARIVLPTLLLHPDASPFISVSVMAELAQSLPNATLQVIAGARHGLPFSHAKDCAGRFRRFLDDLA